MFVKATLNILLSAWYDKGAEENQVKVFIFSFFMLGNIAADPLHWPLNLGFTTVVVALLKRGLSACRKKHHELRTVDSSNLGITDLDSCSWCTEQPDLGNVSSVQNTAASLLIGFCNRDHINPTSRYSCSTCFCSVSGINSKCWFQPIKP